MEKSAIRPNFKNSVCLASEWMDENTFVVWFKDRNEENKTINSPYVEVHVDENNKVVLGENIFKCDNEGNPTYYIDTKYYSVDELSNGEEIVKYALDEMARTNK